MDDAEKREHEAAVAALPGRDGGSWRGAVGRRGVMRGGGFGAKGMTRDFRGRYRV